MNSTILHALQVLNRAVTKMLYKLLVLHYKFSCCIIVMVEDKEIKVKQQPIQH